MVPVEPVEAATVILTRSGEPLGTPWQCYMVRRHVRSDFASDVYVWPGGKVDAADRDPALLPFVRGHPGPETAEPPEEWRALRVAAIRELFEEAGVLLALHRDGAVLRPEGEDRARFDRLRRDLHAGTVSMLDLARTEGLVYLLDALHLVAHWITPESFPRRFDTHFFAAELPAGQEPAHDLHETTDGIWIAPEDALAGYERGEFPLVFATERNLVRLARYRSVGELINATTLADLNPIMPRPVEENGETRFLVPGDPGY